MQQTIRLIHVLISDTCRFLEVEIYAPMARRIAKIPILGKYNFFWLIKHEMANIKLGIPTKDKPATKRFLLIIVATIIKQKQIKKVNSPGVSAIINLFFIRKNKNTKHY